MAEDLLETVKLIEQKLDLLSVGFVVTYDEFVPGANMMGRTSELASSLEAALQIMAQHRNADPLLELDAEFEPGASFAIP